MCLVQSANELGRAGTGSKSTWQWRHNEDDGVSNHQPHGCLPNRLFRHRPKKTSKLRVTGLCEGNSPVTSDDVIKWKRFPRNWPFVRGIHRLPVNSPHKGQWRGALMFSLIYVWINGWVNNREAGDLRRHHAHYDVTVMVPRNLPVMNVIVDNSLAHPC